jgi:hypothetical protein
VQPAKNSRARLNLGGGPVAAIVGAIDAYMLAEKLQKGESIGDMEWFWEK